MKRKKAEKKKMELNMTSMIDVVFLLLVFFVMTFKIVAPEGDFSIKMPPAGRPQPPDINQTEPLRIKMTANSNGTLSGIYYGEKQLGRNFNELRKRVLFDIQNRGGPAKADVEIELAPDDRLLYAYVIEAITAVSGEVRDGVIYKICDKVKFAPRRKKS